MARAMKMLMGIQVFLAFLAFCEGEKQQEEKHHHRPRRLETALEDHWIREQMTHRRAQGEGMLSKAFPDLSNPPPVIFEPPLQEQAQQQQPEAEPAQPEVEQAQPEVEQAQPEVEQAQPEVEQAQPEVEQAQPEVEQAQPEVEQAQPEAEPAQPEAEPALAAVGQQPETAHVEAEPAQPEPVQQEVAASAAVRVTQSNPQGPSLALPPPPLGEAAGLGGNEGDLNQKKCWIFHHMNKSGGTTVKFLLKKWIHDEGYTVAQFDTEEWLQGSDFAKDFMSQSFDFYWGSYTEGLRRHGGERCTWFTIFRHPASRLVSAYFYCQKPERFPDPLCANYVRRVDTMDLVTFAKHWTNFGLRQYVTSFILPEQITSSPLVASMGPNVPGWYKVRAVLDAKAASNLDDPLVDIAMYRFLQPAQNLLANKYKAVGILEEFNTTLHLFNRALELPNYDWLEQYARVGAVNVNNKDETVVYTEEDRVMDIAMTDVTIKRYLALDLLFYEHAMAIHHAQAVQHGLIDQ